MRTVLLHSMLLAMAAATPAAAQSTLDPGLRAHTHVGVGYVANLPRQMMGFNVVVISPALRDWGFYLDAKRTTESRADHVAYDPDITVEEAEAFDDFLMEQESEWQTLNAGVVRVMTPALALYVGGGVSKEDAMRRYFDSSNVRGVSGTYWIDDPAGSGTRVNVMGGAWFRILPSFLVQFGAEAAPRGATVGVSYVLPIGR